MEYETEDQKKGLFGTGIKLGDVVKGAAVVEAIATGYVGIQALLLEAPKYADWDGTAGTKAAVTDKTKALKTGTTNTYFVLNTDLTKIRNKTNMDTKLAANQITNVVCKTQSVLLYPAVSMLLPINDELYEALP